jgi:hypothetical protein
MIALFSAPQRQEAVRIHRSLEVSYPVSVTVVVVCRRSRRFLLSPCVRDKQRSVGELVPCTWGQEAHPPDPRSPAIMCLSKSWGRMRVCVDAS